MDRTLGVRCDPHSDEDQGAGGYLRFANGVECFLHHRAGIKSGVEVIAERGVFFWDWRNVYLWKTMSPWESSGYRDLQPAPFPYPRLFAPEIYPAITGGIQSLIDCIENRREGTPAPAEPTCSGDDMRKVLEIGIALRESHRRGHVPVKLPIEDRTQKIIPRPYRWLGGQPIEGQ
jgi:predicted dehydrogenase